MAQVISLNLLFAALAKYAQKAEYFDHFACYMRLVLRAQSQCRATAETLAVIQNPPVFGKQTNIAAGPQQVNNRLEVAHAGNHS